MAVIHACRMPASRTTVPHPVIWMVLQLPFGAVTGFVTVALTFLATKHGLSITEAALLPAASLLSQWLKWIWAPTVDVTLTPRKWYLIGTITSAAGVVVMAITPMTPSTLPLLIAVVASVSLLRSFVAMSLEAMIPAVTPAHDQARVSAWFNVGNLGGTGLGGGLGLTLLTYMAEPWMAGAILAAAILLCSLALLAVPPIPSHRVPGGPLAATRGVFRDIWRLAKTKGGLLVTVLCFVPIGTGAGLSVLAQGEVAGQWGASADTVAWVAGYLGAIVTSIGCFLGGWLCKRFHPRTAYALSGILLAAAGALFALGPMTESVYVVGSFLYTLFVGVSYASWTAAVLHSIGPTSAATKYSIYASLANFPIWWMGLLTGVLTDELGPINMLLIEAAIGVAAAALFLLFARWVQSTKLPDEIPEARAD